jgi:hypothetical protein
MTTNQSNPGFGLEKWMTIPAVKWITEQGLLVKVEFSTPWGTCDVVGVELARTRVAERIANGQRRPIGPPLRIALFRLIPDVRTGQSTTVVALSERVDAPISSVETDLQALVERRFVLQHPDGSLQSLGCWAPLHTRIVAVELKLERIDQAIAQARSHTAFATESFIGLPQDKAARLVCSGRVREVEQAGIGLLAVNSEGATVLIRPAAKVPSDPVLQMHCVERFWSQCVPRGRRA